MKGKKGEAVPGRTILVIEDEPLIAENIAYALLTEGYSPLVRGTGEEALSDLRRGKADLVLLDIGLPDGNGFDLLRRIRSFSLVPLMVVTARSEEVDRVAGLEGGADDYLVKPFSPRELTARVRALLRRAGGDPRGGRPPSATPFSVDEGRMRISYLGEPLDLSRTEFFLLRLMVERPGMVFSRRRLMEQVWEDPDMSLERTVDAHVKSLRRKLRAVRREPDPIVTHRGLGYSLREDW